MISKVTQIDLPINIKFVKLLFSFIQANFISFVDDSLYLLDLFFLDVKCSNNRTVIGDVTGSFYCFDTNFTYDLSEDYVKYIVFYELGSSSAALILKIPWIHRKFESPHHPGHLHVS